VIFNRTPALQALPRQSQYFRLYFALFSFGCALASPVHAAAPRPEEGIVLLANTDDPDSLRIARHYAAARHVPVANIISLPLPLAETITWPEFVATLWQPLQDELIRRQWVQIIPMTLTDPAGRIKYAPLGHRITALVLCRGVPLRIAHDPALAADALPFTKRAEFRTNQSAVDSELSLIAAGPYPINAFIPNPLFQNNAPTDYEKSQIVKVSRLDGPNFAVANALVDQALAAERTGLLGRAYVDIGGIHAAGDRWLNTAATQLADLGFDLSIDREPTTMPATARIDAPVLYFGWYTGNLNGPFAPPEFRFPPGAIALHIHSFSAHTLRSPTSGWVGPLLARGVTATMGNVFEPYLELTHQPQLFLKALARGATLVDAAYYALPALSWQAVLIGDPLYRPFAVSLDEQLHNFAALPPRLAGYTTLRRMHQLEAAGKSSEALALAHKAQGLAPCLAVGFALAQRLRDAGDLTGAAQALGFASLLPAFPPDEWSLAEAAAQLLTTAGRPAQAADVYRALFADRTLPAELRIAWLPHAVATAKAAKDTEQTTLWSSELAAITPPSPAPTAPPEKK
jgi:uncharacterized protein (TIGR03790 family)